MKKLLAIVLASLMVISLVPVTASADEVTSDITITSHEEHSGAYKVGDTASFTVTVTFNKDLTAEGHRGQLKIHLYDSTSLAALQKVSPDITLTDTIKYKLKGYTVDKGKLGAVVSQVDQEIQFNPASSEMLVKAGTQVTLTFESEKPLTADDMAKHRGNYIVVFTNKEQTQNVGAFVPTGRSVIVGTQEKGKLTVTNTVEDASDGQAADKNKLFTYRLELDDKSVSGEKSGVNFAAGVATFTLKNGDRKTFEDIPVTGFTITESDYGGYNVTYKAGSVSGEGAEAKGEIGADSTTQVTFTNTRMTSDEQAAYDAPTLTYHLNLPGVTEDANKHVFEDPDFIIGGQPGAYTYTYTIRELYAGANDADCLFSGVDDALIEKLTQGVYEANGKTYYFLGWDTEKNNDTSGNNLSDIDFIVTEFNHKVVNGKTTRSFNDPNPTLEITKNTDLYAVWSVNPGFAGYSLSKPNTDFDFIRDKELSDMTLGDNGYAKTGAYKYVVLEKAYANDATATYALTKDIPVADDGSTFLGWFNKKANVDDDPNIASVLTPGAEVTFGDTSNIYSMDAVWGSVSGAEDAAYMYDGNAYCIDISGLAAVITGGAYSGTELATYNKLFNTDNVKYTVIIDGVEVLENVSLEDLKSSSAINKRDVGVYKYEIIATLIIDDASAGKAATKSVDSIKYEREIGRLTATLSIIGGITVSKTVVGGDANQAFNFQLDLENTDGTWGYVINGETKSVSGTTAQETFSLKDGESIMVILTPGTKYTVTEAKNDNYTAAVTGAAGVETTGGLKASGSIGESGKNLISLEYTNTRKTGSLTIKNTTNLNGGTYGSDFTYTITSAGAAFESEKNYGAGVYVDDHTLSVTVAQNGQATVTGLPTAAYTVAQTAPAAVPQWTWGDVKSGAGTPGGTADPTTGVGATLADVAVADSQTTLVLFENVLTRKTGSLTIKKELTGDDVVGTPEFTFTIQAPAGVTFGNASDYGAGVGKDSNGNLTVTVKAGDTAGVMVSNLPVGTYTVVETGKENYSLSGVAGGTQTTNGFTVTVGDGTTTAVTVTNNYTAPAPKTGSLRILKRVTGEDVNVRQDFTFRIYPQSGTPMAEGAVSGATAYGNYYEAKVTFGLGSNSVTVSGLPEGSYRVEELTSNLAPGLFATPSYDKTTVEVRQNATADITVTNPVNTGALTLSKTVVPDTGDTLPAGIEGKEFSFTVSLNLPAGVNSAAVTVNGVKQTVERTGEISVKLKKDGSVRIGNIPYGTTYSVKENLIGADEHFYSDKYTGNETDTLTSANVSVSCQNTYSETATNTGTLRLRKVTQGQTDQTEFTFTVTFTPPVDTTHEDLFRVFKQEQGLDTNNSKTYTVKKGESLLIINIPVGTTYTIQETFNNIAAAKRPTEVAAEFESGTKETTDSITGTGLNIVARGTINADADGDQVTFYNRYLIDLVITKEVKGEGKPSANTEYVFTLEFSGFTADELDQLKNVMEITDATGTRSYDKLIEDFRADNKVTIYLTEAHPTATVNKVPSGRSHYNVEEINSQGAETVEVTVGTEKITGSSTGFKQMSPETAKVTFTNTFVIKTGKLTVKVEATGEGKKPGAEEKYTVHVELTDKNGDPVNGTYGGKEFKDGKADFQLGDGESVVLEDLPYGTKYTVTETDKLGADTVTGEVKTQREFVGNTTVEIQNEYKKAPSGGGVTPPPTDGDVLNKAEHFGYIIGVPGKEVRPEQNITRAEIVTILFRLLTDEARQAYWGEDSGFTDVQKGVWYNHAVATLHNLGIIQGDGSGRFKPMEMITRAELAAMVVRFREKSDSIKLENRFTDVAEGKWYTDEVLLADFYGLMEGDGSNRFKPEDKLTRAEAMTVFNRLLERKPHKDHLLPGMITWSDNMDTGRWYYAQIQEATNSHKCGQDVIIDGKVYETWTEITPMRDWAALEY